MDMHNPRQRRSTVVHDIRFFEKSALCELFLKEEDSDVSIRVEWGETCWRFPAHRRVLASTSEVFRTIFSTTEMALKRHCEIKIRDSSPTTVRQFLKYLYMGTLDYSDWTEAVDLMKIGHKFTVTTLVSLCELYLITTLTFSNVCYLYEISQTYSLVSLEKEACNWILSAAFIVTTTDGFLTMKSRCLKFFLKSKSLNMENECCVLTTLREWAVNTCSRRGLAITRVNILHVMKPFFKFIHWDSIPEQLRTYVPPDMVPPHENLGRRERKAFHSNTLLLNYADSLKFYIDLGSCYENTTSDTNGLNFLKFSVCNHAFVTGFRIIGMFKKDAVMNTGRSRLTLSRDDDVHSVFNLNSPWTKGAAEGDFVWHELTAYLPHPVRLDPFRAYMMIFNYDSRLISSIMWPITRLESGVIQTSLGTINFNCYSRCYGITRLFILPAAPPSTVCNVER